ncbi:MAG: PDZ domain-containing protein [Chloroflexota bacterium]
MIKQTLDRWRWLLSLVGVFTLGLALGGGLMVGLSQDTWSPFVGVAQAQISEDASEQGIVITKIIADSPADEAGMKRGNILLKVDDEAVNTVSALRKYLAGLAIGDEVTLTLLHGDDERTLTATLADRDGRPYLGIVPCGGVLDSHGFSHFGPGQIPNHDMFFFDGLPDGAIILDVSPDSPAAEADLQKGDVITAVAGESIDLENPLTDLIADFQPGDEVELTVERDDETLTIEVTLDEHPKDESRAFLGVSYGPQEIRRGQHGHPFFFKERSQDGPDRFFDRMPEGFPGVEGLSQGVIVWDFAKDSPAKEAGLARGDVITALDGESVDSPKAFVDMLNTYAPGDRVTLTVHNRGDDTDRDLEMVLGEHPDKPDTAFLGVKLAHFMRFRHDGDGDGMSLDKHSRLHHWPNASLDFFDDIIVIEDDALLPEDFAGMVWAEDGMGFLDSSMPMLIEEFMVLEDDMLLEDTMDFFIDSMPMMIEEFMFLDDDLLPEIIEYDGSL